MARSFTARPSPTACGRRAGSASRSGSRRRSARRGSWRCSTRSSSARDALPYSVEAVLGHLAADKKHAGGRLRWVLPTADGVVVRDDIEPGVVADAAAAILAPVASAR